MKKKLKTYVPRNEWEKDLIKVNLNLDFLHKWIDRMDKFIHTPDDEYKREQEKRNASQKAQDFCLDMYIKHKICLEPYFLPNGKILLRSIAENTFFARTPNKIDQKDIIYCSNNYSKSTFLNDLKVSEKEITSKDDVWSGVSFLPQNILLRQITGKLNYTFNI